MPDQFEWRVTIPELPDPEPHLSPRRLKDSRNDSGYIPSPELLSHVSSDAGSDDLEELPPPVPLVLDRRMSIAMIMRAGEQLRRRQSLEFAEGARLDSDDTTFLDLDKDGRTGIGATVEWGNVSYYVNEKQSGWRKKIESLREVLLAKFKKDDDTLSPCQSVSDLPYSYRAGVAPPSGKPQKAREGCRKFLLRGVTGTARPRELLAIMGTSGAGKTTLLDALAGRLIKHLTGTCTVNGVPVPIGSFAGFSMAYVFQGDCLYPTLTVRETLDFAARFQLDPDVAPDVREAVVTRWLQLLGLKHAQDVRVGDEDKKGISGGQMRRLSLGVGLLKDPKVVFLDEPTSGLDSTSAFKVVSAVKHMMRANFCTVMMTIHQPSPRLAELFDNLLILDAGQVIFHGSPNALLESLRICGRGNVPTGMSSVEYLLDVVDELHENGWDVTCFMDADAHAPSVHSDDSLEYRTPPAMHKSQWKDFQTLLRRLSLIILRTPDLLVERLAFYTIMGLLVSSMFWNLGTSFDEVNERASFFLLSMSIITYSSLDVLPLFALERSIIQREYFQESYSISMYVLVQATLWTVTCIPCSALYTLSTYWCVGFSTDVDPIWTFLYTWLIWFCAMFSGNAFCMLLTALIKSPITGISAGAATLDFMMMLGGFFIASNKIPKYWIWYHYISHFTYSQSGLLSNYFGSMTDTQFGCLTGSNSNCTLTGEEVLAYFEVDTWNKWLSPMALICLGLLWRVLHIALLYKKFAKLRTKSKRVPKDAAHNAVGPPQAQTYINAVVPPARATSVDGATFSEVLSGP